MDERILAAMAGAIFGNQNIPKKEYDQQCIAIAQSTIFSYNEVLQTKEILSDIKKLSFSDQDLTDEDRGELLKLICERLAPIYGDSAANMAIERFWGPSEKYSDKLMVGSVRKISETLTVLMEELQNSVDLQKKKQ